MKKINIRAFWHWHTIKGISCLCLILMHHQSNAQVNIVGVGHSITAKDGYELTCYELFSNRKQKAPKKPAGIFFYIQGSSYETVSSKISYLASAVIMGARAVMMEKRGCYHDHVDTAIAYRFADKQTRVNDNILMVNEYTKNIPKGTPVVLVGASEGGDIAAEVAEKCSQITQLILIGSGGGWSQKTEFKKLVSLYPGYLGYATPYSIDSMMRTIEINPNDSLMWAGHPYRRWKTYMSDSLWIHLKNVNIPILLLQGREDWNVPVGSARALDTLFKMAGKKNLTYIEYPYMDHKMMDIRNEKSDYPLLEVDIVSWLGGLGIIPSKYEKRFVHRVKKAHKDIFADQKN